MNLIDYIGKKLCGLPTYDSAELIAAKNYKPIKILNKEETMISHYLPIKHENIENLKLTDKEIDWYQRLYEEGVRYKSEFWKYCPINSSNCHEDCIHFKNYKINIIEQKYSTYSIDFKETTRSEFSFDLENCRCKLWR